MNWKNNIKRKTWWITNKKKTWNKSNKQTYEIITRKKKKNKHKLGAFYLRVTGKPVEIFEYLEPLLEDPRKLRIKKENGYEFKHVDEAIGKNQIFKTETHKQNNKKKEMK